MPKHLQGDLAADLDWDMNTRVAEGCSDRNGNRRPDSKVVLGGEREDGRQRGPGCWLHHPCAAGSVRGTREKGPGAQETTWPGQPWLKLGWRLFQHLLSPFCIVESAG